MKTSKVNYKAEPYTGRKIGSSYMARTGWQVVAYDATTGKRRAVFKTRLGRTPCQGMGWVACHYLSGRSKKDQKTYEIMQAEAIALAASLNAKA